MFSSITRISQIETQARKDGFRTVNLVEIASEVVELYDAAAEQDGTRLTIAGDREVLVTGDRDLIFDAISNLVDNAIKHGAPEGGSSSPTKTSTVERSSRSPMTGPEFPPASTSMFSSAFIASNTVATRRETVSDSAWSPRSLIFMARGSKCLITRQGSSSNFGFQHQPVSREQKCRIGIIQICESAPATPACRAVNSGEMRESIAGGARSGGFHK